MTALDLALTVWTLAALCAVPALTLALHAGAWLASLARPVAVVAVEMVDVLLAIVRRPAGVSAGETLCVPLCGVPSVDRVVLLAFV